MEIFRIFGSILLDAAGANDSLDQMDGKSKKVGISFGDLAGTAAKLGGILGVALSVGSIIGDINDLQGATGNFAEKTGVAGEELAGFRDTLVGIYNENYGESFDDIADAMAAVRQNTGAAGDELKGLTENALTLRDTFDFEVNESVRSANALVKNFGISGEQAYNLIAQAAQQGADKNGDLLDTLNEYSAQFSALGFSAENFANTLISGAQAGAFSVDKVGDAIKEFNIRAKDGSQTTIDAFTQLGFSAAQMGADFAAGGDRAQTAFAQVGTALLKINDPMKQNQIGVELFGSQFEDLQAKGMAALLNIDEHIDLTTNALQAINQVKYNNLGEALAGIGRNIQTGIVVPLGDFLLPKLESLSGWFVQHIPEIQSAVKTGMGVVVGVFEGIGYAIQFVVDHANILIPIIGGLTAAIAAQAIIGMISDLYKKWRVATEAQTTAQWLLNLAMDANPIGILALAIGGLIAAGILLYQNWDTVSKFLLASWDWIKDGAITVFNAVVDFLRKWGVDILIALTGPIGIGIALIYKYWDEIKAYTLIVWQSIMSFFANDIPAAFNATVDFFASLPGIVYAFLIDLFLTKIPYAVGYGIGFMVRTVTEAVPKIIKFFEELPGKIWIWLTEANDKFEEWSIEMLLKAAKAGLDVTEKVISFFAELPGRIWTWLVNAIAKMQSWGEQAEDKAQVAGRNFLDGVIDFFKRLPGEIWTWIVTTLQKLDDFNRQANAAALDIGKSIIDGIMDFLSNLPQRLEDFFGGIWGKVKDFASRIKGAFSGGLDAGAYTVSANNVPGYAIGTNFAPGGVALVGERGPELVNLPRGAQVYDAGNTQQMLTQAQQINLYIDGTRAASALSKPYNNSLTRTSRGAGVF